ncbi:MAG: murein transglycosylase A [Rhodocyclaceae bacterium]
MRKSKPTPRSLFIAVLCAGLLAACATLKESDKGSGKELGKDSAKATVKEVRGEAPGAVCSPCPACAPCAAPVTPPPPAKPMQAARWSDLPGWGDDEVSAAWPAFLHSCRVLLGKPQGPLWRPACDEAKTLDGRDTAALRAFFESRFEPWLLTNPDGTTSGTITGYYEPLLRGSRTRGKPYLQPVLAVPGDLLTIELGDVLPDLKNMRLRGRLQGNKVVPYFSRAEIVGREKDYADRVLLWVDDAVELFFLQIQGSGRVRLPDGALVRVGYADQNGHPYQSVGRVLVERGELKLEQASMQGIQAWARANPARLNELLDANPSYVFFRELPAKGSEGDGPPGALGVPLVAERSIAVDPRHVPLGAPVFLSTTQPNSATPLRRLMLAQDTGGAIRGVVRADFFWGFGAEAGAQAGRMKQMGQMWVLLPPGVAPR